MATFVPVLDQADQEKPVRAGASLGRIREFMRMFVLPSCKSFGNTRNHLPKRRLSSEFNGVREPMNADECNRRASECAANAAISPVESVTVEFLRLAAQWRAMALRENFLGQLGDLPNLRRD
jgi:hypothetical protein